MKINEFGKDNSKKIMLIPGTMMCWKQFEPIIPLLENVCHLIVVSTDGFDGDTGTTFTTAEDSAQKLAEYIKEKLDGNIQLVFGESFGSASAAALFARNDVKVERLINSDLEKNAPNPLAKVSIWYGEKEPNMKKAVSTIKKVYPNAEDHPFEGIGHGEILSYPEKMATEILKFLEQ